MDRRRKEAMARALRFLLMAIAYGSLALFFYQCVRNMNKFNEIDLTSYIRASEWFFNGENPYQEVARRYIYPLFLLIVVYPFQSLMSSPVPKAVAAAVWAVGLYLSFFLALAASWKRLYDYETLLMALKKNVLAIALLVLLIHPSLQDEFLNGQVNLFVMGATAAFFVFLEKDRLFWAAFFLALATSVKIGPGLCVLYIVLTRQYRVALFFFPLVCFFVLILPYIINDQSLDYYRYFVTDVMPTITGSDFEGGFRSFSVISTLSYLFRISWYPPLKIFAVGVLAVCLLAPILRIMRESFRTANTLQRFTVFGVIVSTIPLTFPMSEAHHLLLQIIPLIAVIEYWRSVVRNGKSLFEDRLSLLFILSVLALHIGHGLKDTPIRLMGLIGIYGSLLRLLVLQKGNGHESGRLEYDGR